ncbi:hypothetical protein NFI96_029877 [Prochilodus magdalenae]|nr:hypothetical protein NFI96_029877 [Prochilodus magdalenae]
MDPHLSNSSCLIFNLRLAEMLAQVTIVELDTLLSLFPLDRILLLLPCDFNLSSDKVISSFNCTLNQSPPMHPGSSVLDLIFSRRTTALDITVTPLHCLHFLAFTFLLFLLFLSMLTQ